MLFELNAGPPAEHEGGVDADQGSLNSRSCQEADRQIEQYTGCSAQFLQIKSVKKP